MRLSTIHGNGAKDCQSTPSLASTNTNTTQHHTTPHIEVHKKYSKNMARGHPKTPQNRRKSRPVAPLGDPGALLGAPGAPSGVQGRKSDEKHGSCPPVPGPVLEHFSVKNRFFHGKVRSWSVFFASRCFYLILVRFLVDFRRPGTTKTPILFESGIEIKKITIAS